MQSGTSTSDLIRRELQHLLLTNSNKKTTDRIQAQIADAEWALGRNALRNRPQQNSMDGARWFVHVFAPLFFKEHADLCCRIQSCETTQSLGQTYILFLDGARWFVYVFFGSFQEHIVVCVFK